ncbi:hypothetical protein RJD38_20575 [Vibrio scophthalmi]|uniref:Uncharacterized protein n=1 Tax=Vibrio scophthalmi TaxID=45658 RepID=A0A1B1NUJ4_9VIBR|nr:hypothetical protein [Vibrio scophthalmi]ANS87363.1 hypothetical protein VSVS12_03662 [Vibrio scophthalmi]ANU38600.1 hypothetical protein VSVS05_03563 [Vibrio scophthalmi]MCY9804562.1 hypothetical protein [Vibrio scophthalmi]
MNSTSLSIDACSKTAEESTASQPTSVLSEIITLSIMFLATATVSLLLTLTWVL